MTPALKRTVIALAVASAIIVTAAIVVAVNQSKMGARANTPGGSYLDASTIDPRDDTQLFFDAELDQIDQTGTYPETAQALAGLTDFGRQDSAALPSEAWGTILAFTKGFMTLQFAHTPGSGNGLPAHGTFAGPIGLATPYMTDLLSDDTPMGFFGRELRISLSEVAERYNFDVQVRVDSIVDLGTPGEAPQDTDTVKTRTVLLTISSVDNATGQVIATWPSTATFTLRKDPDYPGGADIPWLVDAHTLQWALPEPPPGTSDVSGIQGE